ncbi:MAG: YerC/YecD family TrpR-related protein [Patescibacteria group bacterium]|nr:YerC/YecD family TrpR-related protein [Patescibacteria group bacterium]
MKGIHQHKNNETESLYQTIVSLKNVSESKCFFRDLLTIEEITEFSKRWQAAKLLDQKLPYRAVATKTGLSTTTVTRVAHWLNNGKGGYKLAINRLKK